MQKYIKMAWRNMWRNWRRTAIASIAIVLGLLLLIFMEALIKGSDQAMFGNAVRLYGGNIQVHAPGYREKASKLPMLPVENHDFVVQQALANPTVTAAYKRIKTAGMVSSRGASAAVSVTAIEPGIEEADSLIAENISLGRFLSDQDEGAVIIGKGLADFLDVSVGDRIVVLGQRKDESMRQHSMNVVGIFDLGLPEAEKGMLFVTLADAQMMYNLRGQVTEVAIILEQIGQEEEVIKNLQAVLPNHEVDSFRTLNPDITSTMQTKTAFTTGFGLVVLLIASIGILNLMLMAVYERTREMGVLAALGWKGKQIMALFLTEGIFIGAIGAFSGCLLAWLLVAAVGQVGIDFSFASKMGGEITALMATKIYPVATAAGILKNAISVIIIAILASVIPAWQASRTEPAKSLHYV